VRDLSDRLTIYGHQLPKIARWHSEFLLMKVDENLLMPLWENVESLDATAQSLEAEIEGIRALVDATPNLISKERAESFINCPGRVEWPERDLAVDPHGGALVTLPLRINSVSI
jgi:hypothetical protein